MARLRAGLLLLIAISFCAAFALAQHPEHVTAPPDVIDGTKTPNLIPDLTAWRLWLLAAR
jgi:hypothetical protein